MVLRCLHEVHTMFTEGVCPMNYHGVFARLFRQNIHVGMSCCCRFSCFRFENVFLPPSVCMLQVSRVLRPGPSFNRNNRAGATTGTTSSPSYLGLLVSAIHVLGAVQPFSFLLGSTLPSRARIEVLWRCFPPKGQSRGDNPFS